MDNKEEMATTELIEMIPEDRKRIAKIYAAKYTYDKHGGLSENDARLLGWDKDIYEEVVKLSKPVKEKVVEEEENEEWKARQINWVDGDYLCSWARIKPYLINRLKEANNLFFIAHSRDEIIGKPQMISETKASIPLVMKVEKIDGGEAIIQYKFIDDRYDKRYDGYEKDSLEKSYYIYRVIDKDIEHMVFSENKLDPELYTFKGMKIKMPIGTELTKSLKIRSIANIFLAKECHSAIKLISQKELVEFTKKLKEDLGIGMQEWKELMFLHPDGKVYLHSDMYNKVRIAQLLSGTWEGYPLHVMNMGPLAKGKTKELEALDFKFQEDKGICEAGNSTPKVLVPSYKEKPASPGYILNCVRLALIDELMKMVANALGGTRQEDLVKNSLGQLNMILEHKKRLIGSGNDNSLVAKATAKCIFQTNPLQGKRFLEEHLDLIDSSTLSRMLCVVQDQEEQEFIDNNVPYNCGNTYTNIYTNNNIGYIYLSGVTTNFPLLIYDNCQKFVSVFDLEIIRNQFKNSQNLVPERLKSLWKGRGLHHTILLLDGLVKWRCLFRDYDPTFTAIEEDYVELEALVSKIILSWKTDLNPSYNRGKLA